MFIYFDLTADKFAIQFRDERRWSWNPFSARLSSWSFWIYNGPPGRDIEKVWISMSGPGLPFLGPAKFEFHEMSQKPWRGFTWLSESPSRGKCTRNAINRMLQLFMFVILRQWSRLARMVYWKLILIVLYWIISRKHFFGMTTRDLAAEPISIACSLFSLVHYFWPPRLVCWLYDAPNESRAATNVWRFNF